MAVTMGVDVDRLGQAMDAITDASEGELAGLRDRVEATSPLTDNVTNVIPLETDLVMNSGSEQQ